MNQQDFGIKRVSVDSSGNEANGDSRNAAISGDGRFVAFESEADNLVAGDVGDRLSGDLGDDLLLACGGQDTFVLAVGGGNHTISSVEDGVDILEVTGGLTFS